MHRTSYPLDRDDFKPSLKQTLFQIRHLIELAKYQKDKFNPEPKCTTYRFYIHRVPIFLSFLKVNLYKKNAWIKGVIFTPKNTAFRFVGQESSFYKHEFYFKRLILYAHDINYSFVLTSTRVPLRRHTVTQLLFFNQRT